MMRDKFTGELIQSNPRYFATDNSTPHLNTTDSDGRHRHNTALSRIISPRKFSYSAQSQQIARFRYVIICT